MLFTTIKSKFAMLLRRPSVLKTAFWVALLATILKLLPMFLQFVGCDNTLFLSYIMRAYDAFSLPMVLTVASFLSLAVLWAVLSRIFPKADRLVRYACSALALLLVVNALWIVANNICTTVPEAFAPKDAATKVSMVVTAVLSNIRALVQFAAALLLVVRYGGRLRQLGVLLVAEAAVACLLPLAALAMQALHGGMVAVVVLSAVYYLCQTAISILTPVMLWRAVRG